MKSIKRDRDQKYRTLNGINIASKRSMEIVIKNLNLLHLSFTVSYIYHALAALNAYTKSVQLKPSNYETLMKRGVVYGKLNKNIEAVNDFDKVIALNPDFEDAYVMKLRSRSRKNGEPSPNEDAVFTCSV